ncbi:type I-E CRISPR-associated protein Cas5/CasD [Lactobacillus xylocopicola]|uniref:Type I-E CRISPR-associated protein Cas5/CasD n=1 Tax=Lactobacillus xylocopicola TaxID=2976676 RepID=A0ABN6SJR1_9LACO|nr:type I-E CRISPR-associated protein Cas5/CasD [Lactobacillus xylocopicola]BDR60577.1 type I-E CRISPR-associated protein Cas5/CasD [Lactobacillus xylocopicola]
MKTITIKLTGPLQSYGNEASFNQRTTAAHPSKSAIIGMIAAAFGYQRDDQRIKAFNKLDLAVRVDQPGTLLTDYQTVEWKKGTRKVTYRAYIQDAVFVLAISSENDLLIDKIKYALHHPKFQLFLGRRSNAPAGVLQIAVFADANPVEVLSKLPWQAANWYQEKKSQEEIINVELFADAKLLAGEKYFMVKDSVGSFDQRNRYFDYRPVVRVWKKVTNPKFKTSSEHDPFAAL